MPGQSWGQGAGLRARAEGGALRGSLPGLGGEGGRGGTGALSLGVPGPPRGRIGAGRRRCPPAAAHLGLGPVLQEVLQVEVGERRPHAAGAGAAPRLEGHPAADPPPAAAAGSAGSSRTPRPGPRLQQRRGLAARSARVAARGGLRAARPRGAGRSQAAGGGPGPTPRRRTGGCGLVGPPPLAAGRCRAARGGGRSQKWQGWGTASPHRRHISTASCQSEPRLAARVGSFPP